MRPEGSYYDERRRKEGEAVEEGYNQWHGWPVRSYDFAWHDRAQPHLAAANGYVFRVGPGWPAHAIPLPALCVTCHGRFRHGYRGSHRSDAGGSLFRRATWDCGPTSRWTHGVGSLPMRRPPARRWRCSSTMPDARLPPAASPSDTSMRACRKSRADGRPWGQAPTRSGRWTSLANSPLTKSMPSSTSSATPLGVLMISASTRWKFMRPTAICCRNSSIR